MASIPTTTNSITSFTITGKQESDTVIAKGATTTVRVKGNFTKVVDDKIEDIPAELGDDKVLPSYMKANNEPASNKVYQATGTNTGTWIDTPGGGSNLTKASVDTVLIGQNDTQYVTPLGLEKSDEVLLGPKTQFTGFTYVAAEADLEFEDDIYISGNTIKIHSPSAALKAKLLRGVDFEVINGGKYLRGVIGGPFTEANSIITFTVLSTTTQGAFVGDEGVDIIIQGEFTRTISEKLGADFSSLTDLPTNFTLARTTDSIALYDSSTSTVYEWKIRQLEAEITPVALKEETLTFTYKTTVPGGGLGQGEIHNRIIGTQEAFYVTPQTVDIETLTAIFTSDYLVELKESDTIFVKGVSTGTPLAQGSSIIIYLQSDSVTKQGAFTNNASVTLKTEGKHPDRSEIDYGTTLSDDRYRLASTRTLTHVLANHQGVNFSSNSQAILGTNSNTALTPSAGHAMVSHIVDPVTYTGFENQASINADGSNLAEGYWHINTNGTIAYFRGHNQAQGEAMATQFLVDRYFILRNSTGQTLQAEFSAVTIVNVSGSSNDVIRCTIGGHQSIPANPTLSGDWDLVLLPAQVKDTFENVPAKTIAGTAIQNDGITTDQIGPGAVREDEIGDNEVARGKLKSDVFATTAQVREANLSNVAMSPSTHNARDSELNRETKFTGYNVTSNSTVGIGEYKIANNVLTIRPKSGDQTNMLNQLFIGQIFSAESTDRTAIYTSTFTGAATNVENLYTINLNATTLQETGTLGSNNTLYIEGRNSYNERQHIYEYSENQINGMLASTRQAQEGTANGVLMTPALVSAAERHGLGIDRVSGMRLTTEANGALSLGTFKITNGPNNTAIVRMRPHTAAEQATIIENQTAGSWQQWINDGTYVAGRIAVIVVFDRSGSDTDEIQFTMVTRESRGTLPTGTDINMDIFGRFRTLAIKANDSKYALGGTEPGTSIFSTSNWMPVPHRNVNNNNNVAADSHLILNIKNPAASVFCYFNCNTGWHTGSGDIRWIAYLRLRMSTNGGSTWTTVRQFNNVMYSSTNSNSGFNMGWLDQPNTTGTIIYRWEIQRNNSGIWYPENQVAFATEI